MVKQVKAVKYVYRISDTFNNINLPIRSRLQRMKVIRDRKTVWNVRCPFNKWTYSINKSNKLYTDDVKVAAKWYKNRLDECIKEHEAKLLELRMLSDMCEEENEEGLIKHGATAKGSWSSM